MISLIVSFALTACDEMHANFKEVWKNETLGSCAAGAAPVAGFADSLDAAAVSMGRGGSLSIGGFHGLSRTADAARR